jgi:hypothetical protein
MDASAKLLKKSIIREVAVRSADGLKVAIKLDAAARDELVFAEAEPDGGRKPRHGAHPDKLRASRCKPPIRGIRCSETVPAKSTRPLLQEEQWLILWQSILMEPIGLCRLTPRYRG